MTSVILPPSPNWYASHLADVAGGLHAFCAHNSVVVADAHDAQVRDVLRGHANRTTAVAFVADNSNLWIVSAAADKSLRLWIRVDAQRNVFSCRRALGKRPAEVRAIASATDAAVAVLGDAAGNLFVWRVATAPERARRVESLKRPAAVTSMACSPRSGDPLVAVGSANGEVAIVDWEQETVLCVLRHHTAEVQCLRWACLAIENAAETSSPMHQPVYLLLSGAPGERLRVYEIGAAPGTAAICAGETVASLGDVRDVTLVSTLAPPSSPANLAQGQRQRLWLSADWVPVPAVRRASGATDAWLVTTGYGGGLLARRVPLVLAGGGGDAPAAPTERPFIRLPGGHSRTVFSVRCILDFSHADPGVRLLTIGMDRAACAWWVPAVRLDPSAFLEAAGDEDALEELEKKAWQRTEREAYLVGLGAFPHALAINPPLLLTAPAYGIERRQPRLLVGCGDASIKSLPLQVAGIEGSAAGEALSVQTPGDEGVAIWQGVPAAVTAVIWHPLVPDIAVFGCADGSLGLAHFGRGAVILAPAKHKAAISRLAWFPVESFSDIDDYDGSSDGSGSPGGSRKEVTGEDNHLLSMSSDGSLFRWPVWPETTLPELFPTEPPKRHTAAGAAVCKDLGKPQPFSHLPGLSPTCMAPSVAVYPSAAVVGFSDGSAERVGEGGALVLLRVASGVGSGPVTHVAIGDMSAAALHADGTLSLENTRLARPRAKATVSAETAAAVTCLALGGDFYIAMATNDGAISIWSRTPGEELIGTLENVAMLRGHSGPVLSLAWLAVRCPVGEGKLKDKMVLVSGAEDQTVKAWDIEAAVAATSARRAAAAEAEAAEAEEEENSAMGPQNNRDEPGNREGGIVSFPLDLPAAPDASDAPAAAAAAAPSEPAVATKEEDEAPPPPPPPPPAATTDAPSETPPVAPPVPAPASVAAPKQLKKAGTAAAPPSLGSKGLLPPVSTKSDSAEAQLSLLRPLLALAAEVAAPGLPADADVKESPVGTFFEDLGCVVDPVDGAASLRAASAALLAGPSPPPAAAKVKAQRAAAVALWSGDVGTALDVLLKHDALTADFVSAAAAAGHGAWTAAARAYAGVLEDRGELHLAALHLLSVGDAAEAVQMYTNAGMAREAATLAAARLPPAHPAVSAARDAYAAQLEGREEWERAAAQHVAAGQWRAAAATLQRRGTPAAARAAERLAAMAEGDYSDALEGLERDLEAMALAEGGAAAAPLPRRRYSPAELEAARLRVLAASGGDSEALADHLPPELLR